MDNRYIVRFASADHQQTCAVVITKSSIGAAGIWAFGQTCSLGEVKKPFDGWEAVEVRVMKEVR